jgi:hypothetical protein
MEVRLSSIFSFLNSSLDSQSLSGVSLWTMLQYPFRFFLWIRQDSLRLSSVRGSDSFMDADSRVVSLFVFFGRTEPAREVRSCQFKWRYVENRLVILVLWRLHHLNPSYFESLYFKVFEWQRPKPDFLTGIWKTIRRIRLVNFHFFGLFCSSFDRESAADHFARFEAT